MNLGHSKSEPKSEPIQAGARAPTARLSSLSIHTPPALEHDFPEVSTTELIERQKVAMRLYESRYASTQRCIAFFVLFHTLGKKVQNFWR